MTVLTQPPSMGDVLKYEITPNYTREVITLLQGLPYPVGSVLGKITVNGKYTLATNSGSDGAQTAIAVNRSRDHLVPGLLPDRLRFARDHGLVDR